MYLIENPQFQRQVVADRHEALRRAAGEGRLRRRLRQERRQRRRAGPER
jgi:hypothetical protein